MSSDNAVITGSPGLLAAHIAADLVMKRPGPLRCVAPPRLFESFASLAGPFIDAAGGAPEDRLSRIELEEIPSGAEVWHFARTGEQSPSDSILPALRNVGLQELNLVNTPYCGGNRWRWLTHRSKQAAESAVPDPPEVPICRAFRTSLTITSAPPADAAQEGFLHFLATLFDLKTEVEERMPDYFEHRALRCLSPLDAPINLMRLERAAAMILAIAERNGNGEYVIGSAQSFLWEEVLERVGECYDLSLLADPEAGRTAMDELFHLRLADFNSHLAEPELARVEESCRAAAMPQQETLLDEEAQEELFAAIHRRQQREHRIWLAHVDSLPEKQTSREVSRDGQAFSYSRVGKGEETLVLLNALGQGPQFWIRLIERLRHRFRVLIWDQRGLGGSTLSLDDQVEDLAAILEREGVDHCHLIAWCTGPKVAVGFCSKHPGAVRSMVFLNTTLKCIGSPPEFDTPYEHNFEPLCRVLQQRPTMAESIRKALSSSVGNAEVDLLGDDGREGDVSADVLALMNRDLQTHVLRPFRDAVSMVNYARQIMDFWNYDMRQTAGKIAVPVLFLASEYDRVASPKASEAAVLLFPNGRILRARGATHYFLYERADVTARMIEAFIEDPAEIGPRAAIEKAMDGLAARDVPLDGKEVGHETRR